MNTAEAVKADRKRRGNLSRKAYADLVGLTPTKISNIEGSATKPGRKLKAGEGEALEPFIEDLLRLPDDAPAPEVEQTDEWQTKRLQLQRDYDAIIDGLRGQPAPIPWPIPDTTIADAKPSDFERIKSWLDAMFEYKLTEPPTEPPAEPSPRYDPDGRDPIPDEIQIPTHAASGPDDEPEEYVYFEDPVTVITDARLLSFGPTTDSPFAQFQEGGPGASASAEPLPDNFQVRHER